MKIVSAGLLLSLALFGLVAAQTKPNLPLFKTGYANASLGFKYVPPSEMQDKTERSKAIHSKPTARTTNM